MNVVDFIRILRKHIVLLLVVPLLLAGMVTFLTRKPVMKYDSETTLYTGIATGSSVEMDKSISSMASNTAFDNLINIVKSRETQQEIAISLLAQHLLLDKADPKYISRKHYAEIKQIAPSFLLRLVVKKPVVTATDAKVTATAPGNTDGDTTAENQIFSFNSVNDSTTPIWLPASINRAAFEQTVKNITEYMQSSDTNFVYKLLNFTDPHYSISAISSVKVQRVGNSDLVNLKYESDDPGICQQTLALFTEVCIKNYKNFKENRSDAVVKYFQFQLKLAAARLTVAEDKLLKFNEDNNIINYYEQSKAVAGVKEQLDIDYNNKRISLAGVQASITRLEEKLGNQQQIQLKSAKIIELRDQLGELNYRIASIEIKDSVDSKDLQKLSSLKVQTGNLKEEILTAVSELYKYGNTTDGLPIKSVLSDWINNVIEAENLKAGLVVMAERIIEFRKQYAIYAPAGANLKRIEREISVSEQEFLEILHGLNLAKLKYQDNELSSNLKAIDPPYYPLTPTPGNRKFLIIIGAFIGFLIVLISALLLEYFDQSLNNPERTTRLLNLPVLGIFPKVFLKVQNTNFLFIANRLLEIIIQNIELQLSVSKSDKKTRTLLVFSALRNEGKTILIGNLAQKLKKQGKKVIILNFSHETLLTTETTQIGYRETPEKAAAKVKPIRKKKLSILSLILGYPDSRVDTESPFLELPEKYMSEGEHFVYNVNEQLYSVKNYKEILEQNGFELSFVPDFVLIELPPIVYYPYPVSLVSEADIPILVCRSNRIWTTADQAALEVLMKLTTQQTHFILNGVELPVIETVLGDLPKKRSRFRRILKKLFRFDFLSRNQI